MDTQNQSSFQQRQEFFTKQKLQDSVNTFCKWRSYHEAQRFSFFCRPAIEHLSRKDAQWLASKNYSDRTKVSILLALGQDDEKSREMAPDKRNQRIFGALALATAATTTATVCSSRSIWPTILMGLATVGLLTKWAYHKGKYESKHADQAHSRVAWDAITDKDPDLKHALTRLAPHILRAKTNA